MLATIGNMNTITDSKSALPLRKISITIISCELCFPTNLLVKPTALALMEAASFCAGVRHKRYSIQQEIAPDKLKNHLKTKFKVVFL
jgi:hypothetical protein